jgi:hypothetical protein
MMDSCGGVGIRGCFSFCIYGTDSKYYLGLKENVRLISEFFPEFDILVYCGKTRRDGLLPNQLPNHRVQLIETNQDGVVNTIHRYLPLLLQSYDVVFVRDADSEVHERDRWCIHHFLSTGAAAVQAIRDHFYHKSRFMAGLTAFYMTRLPVEVAGLVRQAMTQIMASASASAENRYGWDEKQLAAHLWPCVKDHVLVYSNICVYSGETSVRIDCKSDTFCGNVVIYEGKSDDDDTTKRNQFDYFDFPLHQQLQWLLEQQQQYEVAQRVFQDCREHGSPLIDERVLEIMVKNGVNNMEAHLDLFSEFATRNITLEIKMHATQMLQHAVQHAGYRIVGTCNVDYEPSTMKEFVVYYGNFPDDYLCLPQRNRKMYRHVMFFGQEADVKLDAFVGVAPCWDAVDRIYIMGLEHENERMTDVWLQLCAMHAPLDRVHEYRAKKDPTLEDVYIGVTKNHADCLRDMIMRRSSSHEEEGKKCSLFLEDDFVFTGRIRENQRDLLEFFQRDSYDYELCFLSASKMHHREPYDDLLIRSKQICTTSSGYLVNFTNVEKVHDVVAEGYQKLLENRSQSYLYCVDRYWATKLDKIFVFKNKLGFQKPSQSKITGKMNVMLD